MKFLLFLLICGGIVALATVPFWFDRAIVWVLRTFRIFAFPDAIRIAVSLERDTDEWEFTANYANHPQIGSISIGYVGSVCVHLDKQSTLIWQPNFIERRIIYDAIQRVEQRRIHTHFAKVLPA